jgi:hypothetical protein
MTRMSLSMVAAVWAGICVAAAVALALSSGRIGRLRAAAWMLTVAAVLLVGEDPWQLIFMASSRPNADPDGVLGVVDAHTLAHMYGGAAWVVAGMVSSVWVAHSALNRGERWAWTALLVVLLVGGAGDLYEVTIYPHGLPLLPTPADGNRGFGWPPLVAGLAIWVFALGFACGPVFRRRAANREDVQSSVERPLDPRDLHGSGGPTASIR